VSVYVGFRRKHPDKETVALVLKDLQVSNINVTQLVVWPADYCRQGRIVNRKRKFRIETLA
jgi:hypothetical protein